jgi:hypothetical protein
VLWQLTGNIPDSSVNEYLITDTSNAGVGKYFIPGNSNSGVITQLRIIPTLALVKIRS